MVWDTADEDFQSIRDAYLNVTTLDVLALDGPVSGAGSTGNQGLRAVCNVTGFSRSEPLEEALSVSVTVKPAYSANPPTWHVVP